MGRGSQAPSTGHVRMSDGPARGTMHARMPHRNPIPPRRAGRRPAPPPTAPTSQRALAYQGFTQQILTGCIKPGQFVSQRELMALLHMPLGAVREMIPRLEAAGLVKTVPQRGLQITHVDLKLVRNAFQLRAMVEREAVRHFATVATPQELDAMIAAHEDIVQRATAGALDAALLEAARAVDWGLHERMVEALHNEIVLEVHRVNSLRIRLIRLDQAAPAPARVLAAMAEHLLLLQALRRRDADAAVRALDAHLEQARVRALTGAPANA